MSIVPTALRLATAIAWSGWTRLAARTSRLARAASACATRSICPRPIESRRSCHGATMDGRFARMSGIEAANWEIDVASAPAAITTSTTRTATTAV